MKPASTAQTAYLGLGSNLGDRARAIAGALEAVDGLEGTRVEAVSSLYETAPVGPPQPQFLNAVARLSTGLGPRELLEACLQIEARLGRVRGERWGPRTLDIDLLLYNGRSVYERGLVLPHPRMLERAFVLIPLAEIAPDLVVGGKRAADWAAGTDGSGVRRLASRG